MWWKKLDCGTRIILAGIKSDDDLVECIGQCLDLANLHSMDVFLSIGDEEPPDPANVSVCIRPGMTMEEVLNFYLAMLRMKKGT